jgi:deoxyribodipyrimidine photo-lyase
MVLHWFRRDLRLHDNAALFAALQSGEPVLPIFIFDQNILEELPKDDARVTFIHRQLQQLHNQLRSVGSGLAVFHGNPIEVLERLTAEHHVSAVYTNHDYEPYARKRDKEVYELLKGRDIAFKTAKDQVIFEKSEVVKDDGTPYVVFTPFSRKWKERFQAQPPVSLPSEQLLDRCAKHELPFLSMEDIGFTETTIVIPEPRVDDHLMDNYEATRNFPAQAGTSLLGLPLRFGTVSIRELARKAAARTNPTFLNELIWREFFMQILWHFPHTPKKSFKEKYDHVRWDNNEELFKRWCEGKTGYPIVDAGMRQLNATGWMHNRVRMITASFLCKHLLIDWRWGESYFALKLLDYEQASNVGNWQWAAGSGVDAAPYFRIFNPTEQLKKFDPKGTYTRKWVPEWESLHYTKPIVEHKEARERCLRVYKEAVG